MNLILFSPALRGLIGVLLTLIIVRHLWEFYQLSKQLRERNQQQQMSPEQQEEMMKKMMNQEENAQG